MNWAISNRTVPRFFFSLIWEFFFPHHSFVQSEICILDVVSFCILMCLFKEKVTSVWRGTKRNLHTKMIFFSLVGLFGLKVRILFGFFLLLGLVIPKSCMVTYNNFFFYVRGCYKNSFDELILYTQAARTQSVATLTELWWWDLRFFLLFFVMI